MKHQFYNPVSPNQKNERDRLVVSYLENIIPVNFLLSIPVASAMHQGDATHFYG